MFTFCLVSIADVSMLHVVMFTLCLVSIADISLLHVVMFTLCLVSIADVSIASCCYVYIVSSRHSRCFTCYMLLCLRCLVRIADRISILMTLYYLYKYCNFLMIL